MSATRIERLLNLLTLLLNARRPVSLRELRELEEFSAYLSDDPKSGERAFERDKAALLELGVPLKWVPITPDDDDEGQGGYLIDRNEYFLPELSFTPSELALLSIAGAAAADIEGFAGRDAVIRALAKLGFDADEKGKLPTAAYAPLREGVDAERIGAHLEILHRAVAERRRIRITYLGLRGDATEREVDSYGIYYRQGVWYLVGYCRLRQDLRTFHLGRIQALSLAQVADQPPHFEVPGSFDLRAYSSLRPFELAMEKPCGVTIRMAPRLVPAVAELFGPRAKIEQRGESVYVHLTVSHRAALISAVLPYGAAAEIVSPPELRRQIAGIYTALAARYGASEGKTARQGVKTSTRRATK